MNFLLGACQEAFRCWLGYGGFWSLVRDIRLQLARKEKKYLLLTVVLFPIRVTKLIPHQKDAMAVLGLSMYVYTVP